ncbi:vacuolar import/degradation, Vid27-related protein [Artemisia annua]|uniref:Vacuolar import/degradation, Vid27-related protein n=1 Tax=Artemisia annua TaxID=35608 RepID=A0A2U1QJ23_ARTAN|nr:vacuolar import/degradation, Vid27-related protein [Artemisia annua]
MGVDDIDAKLKALKLKYSQTQPTTNPNTVKLYLHAHGKWIISDKLTSFKFIKTHDDVTADVISDDDDDDSNGCWYLKVGEKVRVRVSTDMQLKMFAEQRRVDFVDNGVWAMRFFKPEDYRGFVDRFQSCLFENVTGLREGFSRVGEARIADDTMWENGEENEWRNVEDLKLRSFRTSNDLLEEFEEVAGGGGGIRSVALGALDNSFLVSDAGVQVVKNFSHGIHGKGVFVKFDNGGRNVGSGASEGYLNAQKALLMRGETNMLLMSPLKEGKPHSSGVNQLDIETGKIVTEWKFEKDGTEISMRDITNDTKGSQLDPSESTFLGLDDNRLSQWDMRDRRGMVQSNSPVLEWTKGHQFSRGTNFQCFATTGDGSIVVGSLDGKIRLYSTTSMRQAKTAFPGLGSPITHVDVTYDGKWILGTTDTYLILICTLFTDKDGKTKTGFSGRMGSKIPAPRLLKLTPVDSHTAGKQNKFHSGRFSWG